MKDFLFYFLSIELYPSEFLQTEGAFDVGLSRFKGDKRMSISDPCRDVASRVPHSIDRLQRLSHLSSDSGKQVSRYKQHGGAGGAGPDSRMGLGGIRSSNDRRI